MNRPRGGDGREWGNVDWSNIDLSMFGARGPRGPRRPPSRWAILVGALLVAFFVIPLVFGPLVTFLTDLLWFRSLGLEDVYLRRFTASFGAFVVFFLAFFLLALPNLYAALRPQVPRVVVDSSRPRPGPLPSTLRLLPLLLIPSFLFGLIGGDQWDPLLRWLNAVPFGVAEPLYGRDVGFYFFTLPVLEFVRGWLFAALLVIAIGVVALYVIRGVIGVATGSLARGDLRVGARTAFALARPARAHLAVLGGLLLLLVAAGYWLDQSELLFQQESVLTGAGYTAIHARLPALVILMVISVVAAAASFAAAFSRRAWFLAGALIARVLASIIVGGIFPAVLEAVIVRPDQLNRERPYIDLNIAATRTAYGLGAVEESLFDVAENPLPADVQRAFATTDAVRLWDYRVLLSSYEQLQGIRQYYAFHDVDVDRYQIGGVETPVMLSARELDPGRLPTVAQTWVNRHLVYTHGFGAVVTPVGAIGSEGRPRFALRDIPPQGEPKLDQPRIYYGELTNDYALVSTSQDEFDYAAERDATTRFTGGGGVGIGGLWDRILFALRTRDLNLLVSSQIRGDSRILFNRNIADRARLIAPFLTFDADPYLVVADGSAWWINDAYTTGDRYPYSQKLGPLRRQAGTAIGDPDLNYVRNSVKVATNAYDGSVHFYVVDEADPVIRTLRSIYPKLFEPISSMPASLRAHIRYPEDIFRIQTDIFSTYHMTDPDEFYNRADAWRVANEIFQQGQAPQPLEPYYVATQLPGSARPEFVLFSPLTPAGGNRDNMVAWVAGRADPPEYGKLRVLRFPKDRAIFGPLQIEARIDQDATIRQQLSLLSVGGGAQVIRGNLLVIPVGNSFIYVEPLFVQASQARLPELQRVLLATQDRVVMAESFDKALTQLFAVAAAPGPSPSTQPTPAPSGSARPSPSGSPAAATVASLVRSASDHYQRAQDALRAGDFATYGGEIRSLEDDLARLRALTGQ